MPRLRDPQSKDCDKVRNRVEGRGEPDVLKPPTPEEREQLASAIATVAEARLTDGIISYVVAIVRATRLSADISHGASPRSAAMLAAAARARAALEGRDYVIPDDVKALALPTLRHRIVLSPAAEIDGRRVDDVVKSIVDAAEAPR